MPTRLVHDEDSVGIVSDVARDLDQVLVHGMGVAPRHDESRSLALFGADGTEDIGRTGIVKLTELGA